MQNHLKDQNSPYLLQHVYNPVDWYPWGEEAFRRAKAEDKPVFLSIGYSTCHWCHVMAHESFEDEQIAEILNENFISVKVDKEERPDIDSIYMSVCQTLTGSGGWPTTIFMTPEKRPFFAGTYFPKTSRYGSIGFLELIETVSRKWKSDRSVIVDSAEEIVGFVIEKEQKQNIRAKYQEPGNNLSLVMSAIQFYKRTFDGKYGGFGDAPKFPSPHNLLFLMRYYERSKDEEVMKMAEITLLQMYRGGIFDHVGGGFSRYSTDRYFLVPHFEKMLYDNAMLIHAYCEAYALTKNVLYRDVAEKTARYIIKEMTSCEGGFYSAQDADSEGIEGKYYLFEPSEIIKLLGQKSGKEFCAYFDITREGNFEGKSIPNLLSNDHISFCYNALLPKVFEYRKMRYPLHLDDKILTGWNGLMIAGMCHLYCVTGNTEYLTAAKDAQDFIEKNLCEKDTLYVSYRNKLRGETGFLDDYANEIYALLALYGAAFDTKYLKKAQTLCHKVIRDFYDEKNGGFFLCGKEKKQLFMRPKETYDGATPSGNSMMAYNLVHLYHLTEEIFYKEFAKELLEFMGKEAQSYPAGYAMSLIALENYWEVPDKMIIVLKEGQKPKGLSCKIPLNTIVRIIEEPTEQYPLKNNKTTYYICRKGSCQPPVNEIGA